MASTKNETEWKSKHSSVRPWPCTKCEAQAGDPCRSLTTGRVTDTHTARLHRDGVLSNPTALSGGSHA